MKTAIFFVIVLVQIFLVQPVCSDETTDSVEALKQQVQNLKTENEALKQENQVLRKLAFEKQTTIQAAAEPPPTAVSSPTVTSPSVQQPASVPTAEKGFWLTSSSRKRHNSLCRYYRTSNGSACGPTDGIPCKICGG